MALIEDAANKDANGGPDSANFYNGGAAAHTPAGTPDDVSASNSAKDYDGAGTNVGIDAAKIVFSETTVFSVVSYGTLSAQWENTGQTVVTVYPIKRSIFT